MPRIRNTSNTGRPRARLISTPSTTTLEGPHMTATVSGIKFSDQLAALLDHAVAHGFRIEARTKGRGDEVVVLAPDTDIRPITISEKGARFNKAHYDNIRRDLTKAGMPPLPGDTARPTAAAKTAATKPHTHDHHTKATDQGLTELLAPGQPDRGDILAGIVRGLFSRSSDLDMFGDLAGSLIYGLVLNADALNEVMAEAVGEAALAANARDVDEALALAAAAEKELGQLRSAVDKADAKEAAARADCAAALERARVAEAKAAELDAAISPLRALLGK